MLGLEDRITEEKRDQLVNRVKELYDRGVLRNCDWMAIYDIFLKACQRDAVDTFEQYLIDCINGEDGDQE